MEHEHQPAAGEAKLRENKRILNMYVPLFRDIAKTQNCMEDPRDGVAEYLSVVLVGEDYYSVDVRDMDYSHLSNGPLTHVKIERLMSQPGAAYTSVRRYSYDTLQGTMGMTRRLVRRPEIKGDKPFVEEIDIDDPEETLKLFAQFATISTEGEALATCTALSQREANSVLRKHYAEKSKLSEPENGTTRERLARLGGKAFDKAMSKSSRPKQY